MAKKISAGKKLVVVESPTKAKTIRKFLGKDYIVESCMGHVRDLPQSAKDIPEKVKKQPWATLGVDVDHEFEPIYCVPKNKTKVVKQLRDALAEADELILATDEDREGESISWHLIEVLKPKVPYKRMVFHEITKEAIEDALGEFRDINFNLVKAQEARRILDRLVGYTISPLLWKKVAYGLSAGRVQSVAVRLIVEKEQERLKFKKSEYFGVAAVCDKDKVQFESKLLSVEGKRVATGKDFDADTGGLLADKKTELFLLSKEQAIKISNSVAGKSWKVIEAEEKPFSRKPPAPFITSTLQQEANRKLGMGAREAMQVAQNLYEQGFITYMRTDSTFLSQQALSASRKRIVQLYGKEYLPDEPRTYEGKKVKGAQEAHEAIRPAGTEFPTPEETGLSGPQLKLYELIWMRTMASQMVNSRQKQVSVRFAIEANIFGASGMTIEFPGFLRAYVEGKDDENAALEEREVRLPQMNVNDPVRCEKSEATEHETKPPARFTEASLVQTMEKEGIGRPSTYAAVISTIIDRGYVKKIQNALAPTFTAMVVAKLLQKHLPQYVDLGFTSEMERSLDDIAEGDLESVKYLKTIYFGDRGLKKSVEQQEKKIDADEARSVDLPGFKDMSFRVGRYGAYVIRTDKSSGEEVSASIPESVAPADMTVESANKLIDQKINGQDALGKHPKTGEAIYVLTGRYGPYVQLGEAAGEGAKPKRVSIPPTMSVESVGIDQALQLLELPKLLGQHPDTKKDIKVGLGRFGPYVVCDGDFRSIPKTDNLFTITFERAFELLSQPKKGRGQVTPIKVFGSHPETKDEVALFSGRYGPYVKAGKVNVSLPEGVTVEALTFEKALELLAAKISAGGGAKGKGKSSGEPTKKTAAKKKSIAKKKVEAQDESIVENSPSLKKIKEASKSPEKKPTSIAKKGNSAKAKLLKVSKVVGKKKKK